MVDRFLTIADANATAFDLQAYLMRCFTLFMEFANVSLNAEVASAMIRALPLKTQVEFTHAILQVLDIAIQRMDDGIKLEFVPVLAQVLSQPDFQLEQCAFAEDGGMELAERLGTLADELGQTLDDLAVMVGGDLERLQRLQQRLVASRGFVSETVLSALP
jgi:hypothetical protein